jgi:Linalool dehydratase/isomerase
MVESGYVGVACEPNCVFQICNQPAILGFRLHDLITGNARANEVVAGYEKAWADFGRLDDNGHYNKMISADSRQVHANDPAAPWVDAWCGALMNMWNRDFVRRNYPRQIEKLVVPGQDGLFSVEPGTGAVVMGNLVVNDTCDFGWVSAWTSEMGDTRTCDGLLAHADRYMSPTWLNGGLYYPRNDRPRDAEGHRVEIEPMTGNVLLGYARLNISDGLWGLYNNPWGPEHFEEPALTAVDRDIDVSRAEVVDGVLLTRLQRRTDLPVLADEGTVTISRVLGRGRWRLSMNGAPIADIDGIAVLRAEGAPPGAVRADGEGGLILRCPDGEPKSFELARRP